MQFDDTLTEGDSDMQKIVNRLSMVFTDDYTTELMIVENEEYQLHAEHLAAKEQLAEQKEQIAAQKEQIAEQKEQIAEQNAAIIAKEQELAQQKKQLETKDKQLDEKDKQLDALLSASIKMLASAGIPHEQIAQQLNISVEKVEVLMAN